MPCRGKTQSMPLLCASPLTPASRPLAISSHLHAILQASLTSPEAWGTGIMGNTVPQAPKTHTRTAFGGGQVGIGKINKPNTRVSTEPLGAAGLPRPGVAVSLTLLSAVLALPTHGSLPPARSGWRESWQGRRLQRQRQEASVLRGQPSSMCPAVAPRTCPRQSCQQQRGGG